MQMCVCLCRCALLVRYQYTQYHAQNLAIAAYFSVGLKQFPLVYGVQAGETLPDKPIGHKEGTSRSESKDACEMLLMMMLEKHFQRCLMMQ